MFVYIVLPSISSCLLMFIVLPTMYIVLINIFFIFLSIYNARLSIWASVCLYVTRKIMSALQNFTLVSELLFAGMYVTRKIVSTLQNFNIVSELLFAGMSQEKLCLGFKILDLLTFTWSVPNSPRVWKPNRRGKKLQSSLIPELKIVKGKNGFFCFVSNDF